MLMIGPSTETDLMDLDYFHTSGVSEYSSPGCYSVSSLASFSNKFFASSKIDVNHVC